MKLVVTAFVTVDGIVEAPEFDEHRSGRNAWALRVQNDEDEEFNTAQVASADALLMGRRTWQIWAAFWPTAKTENDLAERMNRIPKYVVSNTLKRADWNNTTIISGDVPGQIRNLKAQPGGDLMVYGSPDLVDELLRHDLVDEYRLLVYPVILGSGKRMFRRTLRERACDREEPELSQREHRGRVGRALVQPDDRERLASLLPHPLLLAPLPGRPEHVLDEARAGANVCSDGGVVEHVELGERARRLEHRRQPVPGAAMRRPAGDVVPVDSHDAAVDEVEPRDAAEQGRLSRPVRTDEARQRAGGDVQRDVVDRPDRAERLRDARELAGELLLRLRVRAGERPPPRIQAT